MTITANTQLPNLFSQNLESIQPTTDCLTNFASELVYTQNIAGHYLTFDCQYRELLDLGTEKIVDLLNDDYIFTPVDKVSYLEILHRILTTLTPERIQCWFKCSQQLLEFELTITPILPRLGQAATTVLVMGRLLSSQINTKKVNQRTTTPIQPDLPLNPSDVQQLSIEYQQIANKITRNIRHTLDIELIWQQTVDNLGKILKLKRCLICPYQPKTAKIQVIAEYHQPELESLLGSKIEISSHPAFAEVLATLEPVIIELPIEKNYHPQKFLLFATSYQEQVNAFVALNVGHECQLLTATEVNFIKELADQLGTAIAHATLYKELEDARQKAEEASRLKSEFLANVSHEIRTPLNGMIGFLKLILEGMADDPEEQLQFVDEAHELSIHLLNILNDILDIAKIEAGKMELNCSPVKLNELFCDVESFTRPQAEMRNLSFQMQTPVTSDEIIVQGNYQRLLQVMLNLVGNAIKFTHEGGVTISADLVVKKSKGKSSKPQAPGMVKVRVADTGIGVSLDKQDKLFQLFSQVDGSRTRHYGGTGLGLTISQKLVEAMGGQVHFYSLGEGLGSTVTFTVPLYQQPVICSPSECEIESRH